jgi:hypothetical protein
MKIMKKNQLKNERPETKRQIHEEMTTKVRQGDQAARAEVIEILNDATIKIGSNEKDLALEVIEKNKMTEAIPALYPLLKEVVASGIGEKVKDPSNTLILIGKDGLPALLACIEKDAENAIPYQTIASILFHWFDENKAALRSFLVEREKEAVASTKIKFSHLIQEVDKWK